MQDLLWMPFFFFASHFEVLTSIPMDQFKFATSTRSTFTGLMTQLNQVQEEVQICAMYWNLLGGEEKSHYNSTEWERLGGYQGQELYYALEKALHRQVRLKLLVGKLQSVLPDEVVQLQAKFPTQVHVQVWNPNEYYHGGIMHQKLWIFDQQAVYVGSANMDWKSLSQVMEVGLLIVQKSIVDEFQRIFNVYWKWTSPEFQTTTTTYFSDIFQATLTVPKWSPYLKDAISNPFDEYRTLFNETNQLITKDTAGVASSFIAVAPREACAPGRAFDEDALVYTIRSATNSLSLAVMDYLPSSTFFTTPIYWPVLTDAIFSVLYSKPVNIRLLFSRWLHTSKEMRLVVESFAQAQQLCQEKQRKCKGTIEARWFEVPGWNDTKHWPTYTRVNHAKYIVTDQRVNVGTSNMQWGYFYTTAGISFNTNHTVVKTSIQSLFNQCWDSNYTSRIH